MKFLGWSVVNNVLFEFFKICFLFSRSWREAFETTRSWREAFETTGEACAILFIVVTTLHSKLIVSCLFGDRMHRATLSFLTFALSPFCGS